MVEPCHQPDELIKIDIPVSILVNDTHHVLMIEEKIEVRSLTIKINKLSTLSSSSFGFHPNVLITC